MAGSESESRASLSNTALVALTVAAVATGGLLLLTARSGLEATFDRWAPQRAQPVAEDESPAPALPTAESPAPIQVEAAAVPSWSLLDVTRAVQTVTPQVEELIREGYDEIPGFRDIASRDEVQARRMQNRWQAWGRIWQNRVGVLEKQMPPAADCAVHAAMEPACQTFAAVFGELHRLATAASIDEAKEHLDRADEVLQLLLNPPQEEVDEAADDEAMAEG